MIHVFVGNDNEAKKRALAGLLESHQDREVLYFDNESFDQDTFLNALSGGDMFSRKYLAVLRNISMDDDFGVKDKLEAMSESDTVFVIMEDVLLKGPTEMLKPIAKSFKTFDLPKGRDERFNIFSITDAYGARDKKSVWVLMQKALRENISAEEILNILIWQTKNLLFAKREGDMKKTGLSPFVYNKSRTYSANYKTEELENISRGLTRLFHEGHLGMDLEPNLEKFILKTL